MIKEKLFTFVPSIIHLKNNDTMTLFLAFSIVNAYDKLNASGIMINFLLRMFSCQMVSTDYSTDNITHNILLQ